MGNCEKSTMVDETTATTQPENSVGVVEMMDGKEKPRLTKKLLVKSGWVDAFTHDHGDLYTAAVREAQQQQQQQRQYASDLILVLDLDQCLLHYLDYGRVLFLDRSVVGPEFLLRPGVVEFLKQAALRYETHIFPAATREYADAVLDRLVAITGVSLAGRWYREHCTKTSWPDGHYVKDLKSLGFEKNKMAKVVHVDNDALNFYPNPSNGIPIRDFHGRCNDTSLDRLTKLLSSLEKVEDVRPFLDERFGVQAALEKEWSETNRNMNQKVRFFSAIGKAEL